LVLDERRKFAGSSLSATLDEPPQPFGIGAAKHEATKIKILH
jgi:hypothetical protein